MSGVFYSSSYNSTLFTSCCEVAICDDQQKCPRCKQDVYPFSSDMTEKERQEAASGYYNHNTNVARHRRAGGK